MRRPFMILLIGAAIWGVSLGLAFIGGIAVGKVQTGEAPAGISTAAEAAPGPAGQRDEMRQRIQSGEMSQEEMQGMRQQFQNQN